MANNMYYVKQSAFSGGELSPDLWARDDYSGYSTGGKTFTNFIPLPYGGCANRPGTMFIGEVKDSSKAVKLLPFQFNVEQAYIVEAGDSYFRYYKDGGLIIDGETIVETTTPYDEADLFDLKTTQSADVLYITNQKYITKKLTRSSHYDWTLADFENENGPFMLQNATATTVAASAVTGAGITLTASSSIFTEDLVGSLMQISHDVTGQSLTLRYTATTTSASVMCKGTWSLVTYGTWDGTVELQWSKDKGTTWSTIRKYTSTDGSYNVSESNKTDELVLLRIIYTHTSGTCNVNLNCFSFVNDGVVKIKTVASGTSATADVQTDLYSTDATKYWSYGSWSEKNGYPACSCFYQNRFCLGGSAGEPLTFWASKNGDYSNFETTSESNDDDSMSVPLVSRGVNSINSMVSMGTILAFTAGGEWKVGSASDTAAMTPKNIMAVQQGYVGTSNLEPLIIRNRILYMQEMGSTVRDFGYSLADDVYKGDDLTLLARHLFKNYEIVDWAFQQEPDGIIWCVRSDGVLLSFTYNKEQSVWAWAKHTTDGEYESVAAIPGENYTEIYFVVKRTINGTTKRYIEKLVNRMESNDIKDQVFLDSCLSYDNPIAITGITKANPVVVTATAHGLSNGDRIDISDVVGMTELNGNRYKIANKTDNTFELIDYDDETNVDGTAFTTYTSGGYVRKCVITIAGLSHLEGKSITCLVNGTVESGKVVSGGSVTLDDYASIIHAGLPYTSEFESLNINYPARDGTIQGRKKAIRGVTLRVEKSYGGSVGINNNSNMETITNTLSTIYNTPAELFTGDVQIMPYSSSSTNATIVVRQTNPLPLTILMIMAGVEFGG